MIAYELSKGRNKSQHSCHLSQAGISGSLMALDGSQVNDTVKAYRVPLSTRSTKWGFSDPEVKNDNRPKKVKHRV